MCLEPKPSILTTIDHCAYKTIYPFQVDDWFQNVIIRVGHQSVTDATDCEQKSLSTASSSSNFMQTSQAFSRIEYESNSSLLVPQLVYCFLSIQVLIRVSFLIGGTRALSWGLWLAPSSTLEHTEPEGCCQIFIPLNSQHDSTYIPLSFHFPPLGKGKSTTEW